MNKRDLALAIQAAQARISAREAIRPPKQPKQKPPRQSKHADHPYKRALIAHHARARQADKLKRTPPWADLDLIKAIYRLAQELSQATGKQHHVDHEVPLRGTLVSGLHVHNNLRIVPAAENLRKGNRINQETASSLEEIEIVRGLHRKRAKEAKAAIDEILSRINGLDAE